MALTRSFRDTVANRAKHDAAFRAALLEEALQALVDGDLDAARSLLRNCINATVGFERLSDVTHLPTKSLMRMVGPRGNPRLDNFVQVVKVLRGASEVNVTVRAGVDEAFIDCRELEHA